MAGALLVWLVAGPLVRIAMDKPAIRPSFFAILAFALLYWWSVYAVTFTERGRAAWEQETRQTVRVRHALRHHVSIGAADRRLVTDRAERVAGWAPGGYVGWPLAAVFVLAATLGDPARIDGPAVAIAVLAVLVAGLLVWRTRVRHLRARRWLADPLPREEETA
jgi:hypothetical protein